MGLWFWFILFYVVIGGLFFLILSGQRKHADYNPNTINYNADLTEFRYFIPKSPKAVLDYLARQSKRDAIQYSFNPESGVILFYPELTSSPGAGFRLELTAVRGGTELFLKKHGDYAKQDALALRQNEFWHKKLEAFPIPYLSPEEAFQEEIE